MDLTGSRNMSTFSATFVRKALFRECHIAHYKLNNDHPCTYDAIGS